MSDGDVIDWQEAMDQCGDDEEFLRELLSDLRGEIDAQLVKIEDALKTVNDQSFLLIMRASHVIKGASSNLMCGQLRETSTNLEQGAAAANQIETANTSALEAETVKVKDIFEKLKTAVDNYHKFLDSVGI
mmetsp:Transcript_34776/g.70994  ORF Transcript_34776/g.70994 Transcript_34776/m.70994 type:complete len:131 (-) Transcript_34776:278-670(-)|eukprot:CAMPEP_0113431508 /NCGR_PEP_ID=MMETSP0013_2-20120614/33622_1 /TAXON_ID=2843 ORGANISM="Skeletonema costatum, Strain 1716" /NCGR_SAMPLE_ID=MMETSP0013_2 /ASSEMBLY_ACC=CAM_ASM_000158 /LENGTH=130 /DNA_ID=CAMNT_0000320505 /DNA_START=33 /DNA_END=425 /DNA_ORIENTATION=- /assembly_acc=CAM_ASM_000158